jgi:predicted nucleotidyltransferase
LPTSRGATAGAARREVDAATREALSRLQVCLRARYGDRLKGLILFGSRARGDHRPDSDADLAVVLEGPIEHPLATKSEIIDDAYDIFLDTGIDIQPWSIDAASLHRPASHRNPRLIRAILRDGIEL